MALLKRAVLFGLLSWLILFALSFAVFPLKRVNEGLFETVMSLAVVLTAGLLLRRYFRNRVISVREATSVAVVWLLCNLVMDYPMFAYGPMKMTAAGYYSQIGLDYLIFPAFAFAAASLALSQQQKAPG
jgi:uncharacterized membrane protein YpjA